MIKQKFELEFEEVTAKDNGGIPAIIVAAGSSSRMNGINKQFANIAGIPVIARTLLGFENSPLISKIILVTKKEFIADMQLIADKYMIGKLDRIIEGGNDRHASVINGINALETDDRKALIHDGARPFVTKKMIEDCVQALKSYDGCLCGMKINDTVKKVDENSRVIETVDRTYLYGAQTPQGVDVALYKKASEESESKDFTDDAGVLEAAGYTVKMVEGSNRNIKITCAEDLEFAETLIIKGEV